MRLAALVVVALLSFPVATPAGAVTIRAFDVSLSVGWSHIERRTGPVHALRVKLRHAAVPARKDLRAASPGGPAFAGILALLQGEKHGVLALWADIFEDAHARFPRWLFTSIPALGPNGYVDLSDPRDGEAPALVAIPLPAALPFLVTALLALGLARRRTA